MEDLYYFWAEILEFFYSRRFDKKKKERRQYEKENNLPKKIMIYPVYTLLGVLTIIMVVLIIIGKLYYSSLGNSRTKTKIFKITKILEEEKNAFGKYPKELKKIERNNPLRKNLTIDFWGNEFYYEIKDDGLKYLLISKGKDKLLNTEDDIKNGD